MAEPLTIVAATPFEARAVKKAVGNRAEIITAGVALKHLRRRFDGAVISCGLAGGLRAEVPTGTVLVPRSIRRPDGSVFACDPDLFGMLWLGAKRLGVEPIDAPLLTHTEIVRGDNRAEWARQGYAGADMESGLLIAPRIACVRVVLDTPESELSAAWEDPSRALLSWRAWLDLPFFLREAPRCAALAANVVASALVA
ncbi:MAG TPA: hypothetical protein VGR69_08005 [Candidatus Rubrimentiphilum sp.]|nr:hypothetical protein [Candidatus Rubrimentiphilum sp.]